MLMEDPQDLVGMRHVVGGELQSDQEVGIGDSQQTRGEHVIEDLLIRIPPKWQPEEFHLVATGPERPDQSGRELLGSAPHERHLGVEDRDLHPSSATSTPSGSLPSRSGARIGVSIPAIRRSSSPARAEVLKTRRASASAAWSMLVARSLDA